MNDQSAEEKVPSHLLAKAVVRDFDDAMFEDQNVLQLQVAVDDAILVQVGQAGDQLEKPSAADQLVDGPVVAQISELKENGVKKFDGKRKRNSPCHRQQPAQ